MFSPAVFIGEGAIIPIQEQHDEKVVTGRPVAEGQRRRERRYQPGNDPDYRRIALPILIFLINVAWPKIKTYFNTGVTNLQEGSDAASQ